MWGLLGLRIRQENSARRYLDLLCRLDYHELNSPGCADSLPAISERDHWRPVFSRIRDCLSNYSRQIQDVEQTRASADVRIRRLTQERQQIVDILDGLTTAVLAVDGFGDVTIANLAARRLLKIEDLDDQRQRLEQCVSCAPLVEALQDTRRRKLPSQRMSEVELTDEHGKQRAYRVVCRSTVTAEGASQAYGAIAMLTDITDQKGAQKRNAEFVSSVSHEMKTPLAGIKAYVELLADGEAEDEATKEEFLNVINGQVDRLQRLIDNLLNLARIEAGVVDVNKCPLSLNDVLTEAFHVLQPSAEQKRIKLLSELSPLYLSVLADRDMLLQAAINLLSNAIKYTREEGTVSLRSRMDDGCIVFEVTDTGVGLSPEDARRVFEKFYRVKKDRTMAAGTGLGLPLAKHIVEDVHSGSLTVDSELGKGSTFRISLPALTGSKEGA